MTVLEQRFMEQVPHLLHDISNSLSAIAERLPEQKQYVWVFTAEQASDGEVEDSIIEVFPTEEAAKKYLQEFIHEDGDEPIVDYVERRGWETEVDEPMLYRAYEDGYYPTNHIECTITKCEIKK